MLTAASLAAQVVKTLPAVQDTQGRSLGRDDPLEEDMATHSSILAGKAHGRRSLAGYGPEVAELDTTEKLSTHTHG